ncbi:MAG: hypothetical protein D3909_07975 [Candidatus Electrothrix sp. ATG1]|nr:hypothetical protein [Candidatus Electrothrix sp. ATG1]
MKVAGWLTSAPINFHILLSHPQEGEMGAYMKVPTRPWNRQKDELEIYMKVPSDSLGSPGSTFIFCCPSPEGRDGRLYESTGNYFEPPDQLLCFVAPP